MRDVPERVEVAPEVVFREVSGEAVILDLSTQRYFSLDPVGTRMWVLLSELGRVSLVHGRLLREYDVGPGRLERDLESLVASLLDAGLLRPVDPG